MDVFSKLPDELLLAVFMHVDHPNRFSRTNKRFHGIACNTLNIVRWLQARYYENETIFYSLQHLGDRCEPVYEILLQRTTLYPDFLLYDLITDGQRRGIGKVSLAQAAGQTEEHFVRMSTVMRLYHCVKRHRTLKPGSQVVPIDAVTAQARIDVTGLIGDHSSLESARDQQTPSPHLLRNREAFVKALETNGSPVYMRSEAVDYAVILLQRGIDVEWRLETFRRMIDFPSLKLWSFLKPVCDTFIGGWSGTDHFERIQMQAGLGTIPAEPNRTFEPTVAKYLLSQNRTGLYRYGYAALDSESAVPIARWSRRRQHTDGLLWRAFLAAADCSASFKEMVTRLLCSYRGVRLLEESERFESCYFRYIRFEYKAKRAQTRGPIQREPTPHSLSSSYHDCELFVKSQAEIDALWLVLHVKNKISSIQAKDPDFLKARITFDSLVHLLAYPWLSSAEVVAALSLAGLKLSKEYNLQTIIKRAVKKVMCNAFCGMHLIELYSKLNNPVPLLERLIRPETLDNILVYPDIDDGYTDDPIVAGLQGYKLDLPTRKASYSDMGPKIHLPLALGLLEMLRGVNSPALKLLLKGARQRKLDKIVKTYESAGIRE